MFIEAAAPCNWRVKSGFLISETVNLMGVAHTLQPLTSKGGEICSLLSSWGGSLWRELRVAAGGGTETAPVSSADTCRDGTALSRMWLLALVLTSLGSFTAWGESY